MRSNKHKKKTHAHKHSKKTSVSKTRLGSRVPKKFVRAKLEHVIDHLHALLGEVQKIQVTQSAMLRKIGVIVTTQKELADGLKTLGEQVDKIATETDGLKE